MSAVMRAWILTARQWTGVRGEPAQTGHTKEIDQLTLSQNKKSKHWRSLVHTHAHTHAPRSVCTESLPA